MDETDRELHRRAVEISRRAYAPYSNFFVGAVLRARDGTLFDGVNVENAAYPLGVCAEKSAYVAAVTAGYKPDRKSTRLNSSHIQKSRMPSSA